MHVATHSWWLLQSCGCVSRRITWQWRVHELLVHLQQARMYEAYAVPHVSCCSLAAEHGVKACMRGHAHGMFAHAPPSTEATPAIYEAGGGR